MNNKNKFRVYDNVLKLYIISKQSENNDDVDLIYTNSGQWYIAGGNNLSNDRYIIEQCVGIKDQNGVYIFEGDIVNYDGRDGEGVVKWDQDDASFYVDPMPECVWGDVFSDKRRWERLEIVGNKLEYLAFCDDEL